MRMCQLRLTEYGLPPHLFAGMYFVSPFGLRSLFLADKYAGRRDENLVFDRNLLRWTGGSVVFIRRDRRRSLHHGSLPRRDLLFHPTLWFDLLMGSSFSWTQIRSLLRFHRRLLDFSSVSLTFTRCSAGACRR